MAQGVEDAVFVNRRCDVVSLLLKGVNGVAHSDADACLEYHGGVVASVAKSHRTIGVETFMTSHCKNAFTLVGTVGGDICKLWVPAS